VQTKQGWGLADDFLPEDQQEARVVGLAAGLGCAVVASLVGAIGLGLILDQWLDTTPVFTLIGVAVGLIAAGYELYELVQASSSTGKNGPIARTMAQRMQARQAESGRNDQP
jgi:F0F1-type ATP synthase assembly protein I